MRRRLAMLVLLAVVLATTTFIWVSPSSRAERAPEWVQDASLGVLPRLVPGYGSPAR